MAENPPLERLLAQTAEANESLSKLVEHKFDVVSNRLNSLTTELIKLSTDLEGVKVDVGHVKGDIAELSNQEIRIKNGGKIPVQVRRDDVIGQSYEFIKPGGYIDQKLDSIKADFEGSLRACQEEHTPTHMIGKWGEKAGKWEKAGKVVLWVTMVVVVLVTFLTSRPDSTKHTREIQQLIEAEFEKHSIR